jgi:1-hydroxy-2-isopentenylcarotenoid 3,4-desaturase
MKSNKNRRVAVVGGGIGGMAGAALLAKDGFDVTVIERNDQAGGRARVWKKDGFTFDMGPSWYLMPEVFDRFFALFGEKREDWYTLKRLDPSYRLLYGPGDSRDVNSDPASVKALFESLEPGSGVKLQKYLADSGYKYDVAMKEFLYREYRSIFDFLNKRMIREGLKLKVLGNLDAEVSRIFKDRRTRQILEYAMVFLGTAPKDAPGLYSIMSHVDLSQGVYYPLGGLVAVANALQRLAESRGARFMLSSEVDAITVENGKARGVTGRRLDAGGNPAGERFSVEADIVIANADYAHVETRLLAPEYRSLKQRYWESRVVAPTLFVVFLGLSKTLPSLAHHNLYFQEDWNGHFDAIFKRPAWPQDPCFYLSCISKTDPDMAPPGGENVFLLVPVAAGLNDDDATREAYADMAIRHVEKVSGEHIREHIVVKRIYSQRDFSQDYNAWKGTSLGISHTLGQSAVFRPSMRSRKVENLFYAGQYTHPGIGVPMVLIAAELAAGIAARS